MADVFIAYSNRDRALASSLAEELSHLGITVWWDTSLILEKISEQR